MITCECGYSARTPDEFHRHIIERYRADPDDDRHWDAYAPHWEVTR